MVTSALWGCGEKGDFIYCWQNINWSSKCGDLYGETSKKEKRKEKNQHNIKLKVRTAM